MDKKFKLLLHILQLVANGTAIGEIEAAQLCKAGLADAKPPGPIQLTQAGHTLLTQLEGMLAAEDRIARDLTLTDFLSDLLEADALEPGLSLTK